MGQQRLQQKRKKGKLQENLHHSNSQADSIIPTKKESHSSKCTIFAVKLDNLSSSMDICFIKPQDLLALSIDVTSHVCNLVHLHHKHHLKLAKKNLHLKIRVEILIMPILPLF
jgi:hypothetical protein